MADMARFLVCKDRPLAHVRVLYCYYFINRFGDFYFFINNIFIKYTVMVVEITVSPQREERGCYQARK
jgi:hypothetical protein